MVHETSAQPNGRDARVRSRVFVAAVMFVLPLAGWAARALVAEQRASEGGASRIAAPSLQDELSRLDGRTSEPLTPAMAWEQKRRMMAFLNAIEEIDRGLASEDWEMVTRASGILGTSPETR